MAWKKSAFPALVGFLAFAQQKRPDPNLGFLYFALIEPISSL
jgi:hypothetical protein